ILCNRQELWILLIGKGAGEEALHRINFFDDIERQYSNRAQVPPRMPGRHVTLASNMNSSPAMHSLLNDVIQSGIDTHLFTSHPIERKDIFTSEDSLSDVGVRIAYMTRKAIPANPGI